MTRGNDPVSTAATGRFAEHASAPGTGGGYILGLSCFYHDSAAVLLRDGAIVAAAQEERFTRRRHDPSFPRNAIAYCLREEGITVADLAAIAFYDKPFLKYLDRGVDSFLAAAPHGFSGFRAALEGGAGLKLNVRRAIRRELGYAGPVLFPLHHESHAASAFYPSPFEEAAVVTVDGVGEWQTTTIGHGHGADLKVLREIRFPHSLGLLYSAATYHAGFRVNSGEYKLMGLAPYGEPRYVQALLDEVIDLREDGSFRLNLDHFDFLGGTRMTARSFDRIAGGPPRAPESELLQRHMDLARSVQEVLEAAMLRMCRHAARETGSRNLVLAGGVALNAVANGRVARAGIFDRIWVQPAAHDAGGALGAALIAHHRWFRRPRVLPMVAADAAADDGTRDAMRGALLGPAFDETAVRAALDRVGAVYERMPEDALDAETARLLAAGQVVGWFQGRMEFGPRALGARSILADPRAPDMQSRINLKIKFREGFRPFAPAVLRESAERYFDLAGLEGESPYMLQVVPVRSARETDVAPQDVTSPEAASSETDAPQGLARLARVRGALPAVTHVDGSARVQTVDATRNPRFHRLLKAFEAETGCPVLVNTSFNVRGEPIVCTPEDAWGCFLRTHLDALVIGPFLLRKAAQPPHPAPDAAASRPRPRDGEAEPTAKDVRMLGVLFFVFAGLLAWVFFRAGDPGSGAWWRSALVALPLGAGTGCLLLGARARALYRLWARFGALLGRVVSPVVLGILYYGVVTPYALAARKGRDPLFRRGMQRARGAETHWRAPDAPFTSRKDLTRQY